MTLKKLVKLILSKDELENYAFSGNCFTMAVALKDLVPEAQIFVVCNEPIHKYTGKFIGHCAIKYQDKFIDGNGIIEPIDFESWGMLDNEDTSYIENIPQISPKKWKELSNEVKVIEVTVADLDDYIDQENLAKIKEILGSNRK